MILVGCLGTANYWTTLPFLLVIAALACLVLVSPHTARRLPGRDYSDGWTRVFGLAILTVAIVMGSLAIHEARTDPDCMAESSAPR